MSRKGKKAIVLPSSVQVKQVDGQIVVKGPKGELSAPFGSDFGVSVDGSSIKIINNSSNKTAGAYFGLYQSLVAGMVEGVSKGYEIILELVGVGYRAQKQGAGLSFTLGFSHPVEVPATDGITFELEGQTVIFVRGIDKQKVGQVASKILALRNAKNDPYKGKGVRYRGAILRRKVGKKVK